MTSLPGFPTPPPRGRNGGITYGGSGVSLDAAEAIVPGIGRHAATTHNAQVLSSIGGFAGLWAPEKGRWRDPVFASSADGVGTKTLIAKALGRYDTIGVDLVAMVVDDLVVVGAQPVFLLDYLAVGRVDPAMVEQVVAGVAAGCRIAQCALLGGETAEHPDAMESGDFDLAGFGVGVVERDQILGPQRVQPGDQLLAIASSGLHSNGYSLARHAVEHAGISLSDPFETSSVGEELLTPTRIYAADLMHLLSIEPDVHALCHVTGGGLPGNLPRSLPPGLTARIDWQTWTPPPVFSLIRDAGDIADDEMARATNLGVGMVVVAAPSVAIRAQATLAERGLVSWIMGDVVTGT